MTKRAPAKKQPQEAFTSQVETTALPADALPRVPEPGAPDLRERLQDVLPAIHEVAQKVGGFRKLAEIADELDRMEK
jgi:hypothetical protein